MRFLPAIVSTSLTFSSLRSRVLDVNHVTHSLTNTIRRSLSMTSGSTPIRNFDISTAAIQGRRPYMEDTTVIYDSAKDSKHGDGESRIQLYGVFDGHAGSFVSNYLRDNFISVWNDPNQTAEKDVSERLIKTLDIIDQAHDIRRNHQVGSTACITAIETIRSTDNTVKRILHTANVGDSRAILCRGNKAIDLSVDHKPNSDSERKRIEDLGGRVEWVGDYDKKTGEPLLETGCYRVQGNLALSRAIGDYYLKPYVSPTPDITRFEVEKDDRFILVATDGFWDVFSSQEAVDITLYVREQLEAGNYKIPESEDPATLDHAAALAGNLVFLAFKYGSYDNISVTIKWL